MRSTEPDRSDSRVAHRALLALASVVVSLLLAEGMARLFVSADRAGTVEGVFQATDARGVNYTLLPDFDGTAFNTDLRTNHPGFRGPQWTTEKASEVLRIALIGDSHAFGYGVPFESTTGEGLARDLGKSLGRPVEVLNFAVTGYNSLQELGVLEHFALPFRPDLVVIVPSSNDDEKPAYADPEHFLVSQPVAPGERTPEQSAKLAAWRRKAYAAGDLSRLWTAVTRSWNRLMSTSSRLGRQRWMGPIIDGPVAPELVEPVMEPVRRMIALSREAGARVLIATFAGSQKWRLLFRTIGEQEQVPVVELLGVFPETWDWDDMVRRFSLGWNSHLGVEGHRRWAKAIADRILADGLATPVPAAPARDSTLGSSDR